MIIGFTGSREGMSERQKNAFLAVVSTGSAVIFLHGGCRGADVEARDIVASLAASQIVKIECHPGDEKQWENDSVWAHSPPNPYVRNHTHSIDAYLNRNKTIAKKSDILIAAPLEMQDPGRGGTWDTIRKAKALGKPIILLDR